MTTIVNVINVKLRKGAVLTSSLCAHVARSEECGAVGCRVAPQMKPLHLLANFCRFGYL